MADHSQYNSDGGEPETEPAIVLPFPGLAAPGLSSIPEYSPGGMISPQPIIDNSGSDSPSLADTIERELASDGRFTAFLPQVIVSVEDGTVQLSGMVPTEAQKQSLLATVRAMPGVAQVDDSLAVG